MEQKVVHLKCACACKSFILMIRIIHYTKWLAGRFFGVLLFEMLLNLYVINFKISKWNKVFRVYAKCVWKKCIVKHGFKANKDFNVLFTYIQKNLKVVSCWFIGLTDPEEVSAITSQSFLIEFCISFKQVQKLEY